MADRLPSGWTADVVEKDHDVINMGRGESSYLWWIDKNWDQLEERINTVCFCQGWPFDHVPDFELRDVARFEPLGGVTASMNLTVPHDQFVALEWPRLFGKPFPGTVDFPAGSCFLVSAAAIRENERAFYQSLFEYVTQTPDFHSHVLERMWPEVFNAN